MRQNIFLIFISLLSGVALVFGANQVFKNFYKPYPKIVLPDSSSINSELENFYRNYSEIIALQNKDTDADGLSDYDELYVYNTSPYLKDTDSDGLDDKTELSSGFDPLCAKGQTCESIGKNASEQILENLENTADVNLTPNFLENNVLPSANDKIGQTVEPNLLPALEDNPLSSPESLRKLLLENGMKKEDLDKMSDEELLKVVEEAMNEGN